MNVLGPRVDRALRVEFEELSPNQAGELADALVGGADRSARRA